jgi:hypothetical protein
MASKPTPQPASAKAKPTAPDPVGFFLADHLSAFFSAIIASCSRSGITAPGPGRHERPY